MHLLRKLFYQAGMAEDAATEIFAECLRQPVFLDIFLREVVGITVVPPFGTVETQVGNVHALGVPDMVIELPDAVWRIVVENKFGAGLTWNQPEAYVADLKAHVAVGRVTQGMLVVQCPEARLQRLRAEIRARLPQPTDADMVTLVTWEQTIRAFSGAATVEPATYIRNGFVETVQAALKYRPPAPVSEEEMIMLTSQGFASAAAHLCRLISEVRNLLQVQGLETTRPCCTGPDYDSLGFYIGADKSHWFGSFWQATAAHGLGPLWLQRGGPANEAALQAEGYPIFQGDDFPCWGGILVPLTIPSAATVQDQAGEIVAKLKAVIAILDRP